MQELRFSHFRTGLVQILRDVLVHHARRSVRGQKQIVNQLVEETKRKKAILDEKGLVCYTFGVAGTSPEKEKNRKLFEFAKLVGCKVIVVEPNAAWNSAG